MLQLCVGQISRLYHRHIPNVSLW